MARTDAAAAQQLNRTTLATGKEFTFGGLCGRLGDTLLAPSHGVYDVTRGEYVNVAWDFPVFGTDATYRVFRVNENKSKTNTTTTTMSSSSDERDAVTQQQRTKETASEATTTKPCESDKSTVTTDILGSFRAPPTYLHCIAVTKRYVIIMLPPVRINVPMFILSLSLGDALRDTSSTRLIVIDRRLHDSGSASTVDGDGSGVVAEYTTDEKLWAMHVSNAWDDEDNDEIVIETISSPSMYEITSASPLAFLDRDLLNRTPNGPLLRLTLPNITLPNSHNKVRRASRTDVIELAGELPTINPRFRLKKHRYVYTTTHLHGLYNSRVRKIDTETGVGLSFAAKGCVFDEPLFVADPRETSAEDDGVVLLSGFDSDRKRSVVCVLNGRDLKLMAVADMEEKKVRVPMAFHWYADDDVDV